MSISRLLFPSDHSRHCTPGDDPPRDRTSELRQLGFPSRHLGPMQMTTDTALGVTKRVVDDEGDSCFFSYCEIVSNRL